MPTVKSQRWRTKYLLIARQSVQQKGICLFHQMFLVQFVRLCYDLSVRNAFAGSCSPSSTQQPALLSCCPAPFPLPFPLHKHHFRRWSQQLKPWVWHFHLTSNKHKHGLHQAALGRRTAAIALALFLYLYCAVPTISDAVPTLFLPRTLCFTGWLPLIPNTFPMHCRCVRKSIRIIYIYI